MPMRALTLAAAAALTSLTAAAADAPQPGPKIPAADRVAVLLTDWAEPEGFDDLYRKEVVKRSFGEKAQSPDEPCTQMFVGQFPFRVQLGLVPMAVGFRTQGMEGLYDSVGLYRLSADRQTYVSIYDPTVTVAVKDVPPNVPVTPAKDVRKPVSRSFWAIDPRDGTNYLDGVFVIGSAPRGPGPNPGAFPNGIRDADEYSYAAAITDMSILYEDLTPRLSPATVNVMESTKHTLHALFGDAVDVREGAYSPTRGLTRFEEDVAADFVREGFRRMVLVRETTDNNNYANDIMTRGYIEHALCKRGLLEGLKIQQSRQVGRTPEYNTTLVHVAKKNLDRIRPGSEVTVMYTTYGLPFPDRASTGPFAAPHPWSKEVYHENAYNNYIAFKRYLDAYYGDRYRLVWNRAGTSGDRRLDNWYSYGLVQPQDFTDRDPALRFRTLRENIDAAKKEGRKEILAVLSHWYYNGRDPLLAVRVLQKIPLNTRQDFRNGQYWVEWCEKVDSSDPVKCEAGDASLVHLQYSETFDSYAKEFGIGYANVIRGAVERFGTMPSSTGLEVVARGPVDREGGGEVAVKTGRLKGAKLVVAKDAHPGEPESFDGNTYRAFTDPADNLVSAWDSFEGYIGTQRVPLARLGEHSRVVSDAVLFGPYRTIVNRPATITLPLAAPPAADAKTGGKAGASGPKLAPDEIPRLRAFVYNEVSEDWDPVFPPAGSAGLRFDPKTRTASFETQVFGVFALAVTPPDWNPRKAIRHRYHQPWQ